MDCCLAKCLDPLVRGGCLALCLSLVCEADIVLVCALPLVRDCIWLREELCTLKLYLPKFLVEVPCVGSPVWTS